VRKRQPHKCLFAVAPWKRS